MNTVFMRLAICVKPRQLLDEIRGTTTDVDEANSCYVQGSNLHFSGTIPTLPVCSVLRMPQYASSSLPDTD
jgi:hypothetical protein